MPSRPPSTRSVAQTDGPGSLGAVGSSYHQFCPVSKAMELLDERWTMLVVRELVTGSQRFNDLRRGLPKMSPTLLSKRLGQLARAGLVERHVDGNEVHYLLTPAGEELRPIVEALGAWGVRWIGHLGEEDLDPSLLLWDMHRNVDHAAVPTGRTVVHFQFPDVPPPSRHWWLVITADDVDVCDTDPGHDVSVSIKGDLRCVTQLWRGDITWSEALRSGRIAMYGPDTLRRGLPDWFVPSRFASILRAPQPLPPVHAAESRRPAL